MNKSGKISRRGFIGKSAGIAAPCIVPAAVLGKGSRPGANEKVHVGLIGCGGMGSGNLRNCARHPDVVVTALCDVQKPRLDKALKTYSKTAKPYTDYRELLAAKDVDAVIIATPPHWHCLQAIEACEAGKDIYLQKPMTLHLGESLAVLNAVAKHKRICQVGTQIHASQNYRRVVEHLRGGYIGKVGVARTFNVMNQGEKGVGRDPGTPTPKEIDWEMWIGPGPMRTYNRILAASSFNHCSFMDYSGGWLPGMAPHIIDLPVWALDLGYPEMTACSGGRYVIRDDGDAPDVQEVLWQYPGATMTWMGMLANSYGFDFHDKPVPKRRLGIYFHGVDATMYCNYNMFKVVPEGDRLKDREAPKPSIPPSPGHEKEWVECVKSRREPSCNVAYHTRVDVPLVLANLSLKLGRSIRFDPAKRKIVGDPEAARQAVPTYRDPWKFPAKYLEG